MPALSQTPANVAPGEIGAQIRMVTAGETVAQGMPVYLKTSDSKYWKADADTAAEALVAGVALTPASADGPMIIQTAGLINLGGTLAIGSDYYIHTTAGAIGLIAELGTGDFKSRLGQAQTAALLNLQIDNATVASA